MIIDNHSDLMLFLNEYGNDNITFFFDVVSRNFSISTKAKKFFGKEKLTMETLSEILDAQELSLLYEKIGEIVQKKEKKGSMFCRVKDASGKAFLCTLDVKILFNEESKHNLIFGNIYPHRNNRESLDPITNFKTVNYLYEHLRELKEKKTPYLMLGLKLLKFNDLTSIYGYDFTNEVLRKVCDKVKKSLSQKTSIYRLEGTRFVGICENLPIEAVEDKFYLLQDLVSSFEYRDKKVGMTLIGSIIDANEIELTDEKLGSHIMSSLDKSSSQNKYSLMYMKKEDIELNVKKMEFYNHIQASITNNFEGFYLKYQPLISSKGGNIIGAEALLRWKSSIYGEVLPNDFIDYVETQPMFYDMGLWILEKAMEDAKAILFTHPNFVMNVNISYSQLERREFKHHVIEIIEKLNYPFKNLQLELTERCRDINPEYLYEQLKFFSDYGILEQVSHQSIYCVICLLTQ